MALSAEDAFVGFRPFSFAYLVHVEQFLVVCSALVELGSLFGLFTLVVVNMWTKSKTKCINLVLVNELVAATDKVAWLAKLGTGLD